MSLPDETAEESNDDAQFVRLLTQYENDIHRYVLSLVFHPSGADDVMQNVAVLLWKKFAQYDPSRPFLPWAFRFAYFEVLKHRQKTRFSSSFFGEELIEKLAANYEDEHDIMAARRGALDSCLSKLSVKDQELVRVRYGSKETIQEAAKRLAISVFKLYHSLDRIRRNLMVCINRTLIKEGWDETT